MKFRGWVIEGPSNVQMKEFDTEVGRGLIRTEDPEFGTTSREPLPDDAVILRNVVSSICGSDKWLYPLGGDSRRPTGCQFGHEMVSVIEAKGKDVTDFEVGERVFPFPLFVKESYGFAGRPGAFSELVVCEHAKLNHNLYKLPECISDTAASMIEPFSVGFQSAINMDPKPGDKCVVLGAGPIGLAAAIALREYGVEDVVIVNRSKNRLEVAKKLDRQQPFETLSTLDEGWQEWLFERFGETRTQAGRAIDVDIWIDATGSDQLLEEIYMLCKNFAKISVVAVHHKKVSFDLMKLTFSQVMLLGSAGYRPAGSVMVINAMASGRYDVESMVTHVFPFEKFDEAMELVQDGSKCLKCQIDYRL